MIQHLKGVKFVQICIYSAISIDIVYYIVSSNM